MSILSNEKKKTGKIVVADFVCPTRETRRIFNPDYIVWMNTIKKSLHEDTNLLFEPPFNEKINFIVKEKNAEFYSKKIAEDFKNVFNLSF